MGKKDKDRKSLNGPLMTWGNEQQMIAAVMGISITPGEKTSLVPKIGIGVLHKLLTGEYRATARQRVPEAVYDKLKATYENLAMHCAWGSVGRAFFERSERAGMAVPTRVVKIYSEGEVNDFEHKIIAPIRRYLRENFYFYAIPDIEYEKHPVTGGMVWRKNGRKGVLSLIPRTLKKAREIVKDLDETEAERIIRGCGIGAAWVTHGLYRRKNMGIAANAEESMRLLGDYAEIITQEDILAIAA